MYQQEEQGHEESSAEALTTVLRQQEERHQLQHPQEDCAVPTASSKRGILPITRRSGWLAAVAAPMVV
jgi:hypothetical protein